MTQNEIGRLHKEQILNILKTRKNVSRADLARILDLKKSSISLIIEKLTTQGFILEAENDGKTAGNGRKPTPLEINPEKGYIVGIEAGFQGIFCILVDFQGNVCARAKDTSAKKFRNGEELACAIYKIFSRAAGRKENILGIGIGISARVDVENGMIISSNLTDGQNIPLKKIIEDKTGIPVFLDSNDNVGGFCEKYLGKGINSENMVYIQKRQALGAAIFINGKLYRGLNNYAGELSFFIGRLEEEGHSTNAYGAALDMKRYFLLKSKDLEHSSLFEKAGNDGNLLTEKMIYDAARAGDAFAAEIVYDVAAHYGMLAAYLADFMAPDMIVFGGDFVGGGDLFIDTARMAFRKKAFKDIADSVDVELSTFYDDAVTLGATVFALDQLYKKTNLLQ